MSRVIFPSNSIFFNSPSALPFIAFFDKKLIEAMPELKGQPYMQYLKDVYTTGETYYGNESFVNIEVDGKIVPTYVNFIYKALRDSNNTIYGILTMGYNVTEQVEARKKMEYNETTARLVAETAMLGTVDITYPEVEFIGSKRLHEIFGFAHTDTPYNEIFDRIHPDDKSIREAANKLAHTTGHVGYEVRVVWPDNSIHWISTNGKIFFGEDKMPVRVLGTVMDITERVAIKQNIELEETRLSL